MPARETRPNGTGVALVKIAALYMMAGLAMGMWMAVTHNHTLSSVHSHVALLGWATMAIAGLVYITVPACASSRLADVHFWLHNIGLPIMSVSLATLALTSDQRVEPFIGLGATLVVLSLAVFTVNVLRNGRTSKVQAPAAMRS